MTLFFGYWSRTPPADEARVIYGETCKVIFDGVANILECEEHVNLGV